MKPKQSLWIGVQLIKNGNAHAPRVNMMKKLETSFLPMRSRKIKPRKNKQFKSGFLQNLQRRRCVMPNMERVLE